MTLKQRRVQKLIDELIILEAVSDSSVVDCRKSWGRVYSLLTKLLVTPAILLALGGACVGDDDHSPSPGGDGDGDSGGDGDGDGDTGPDAGGGDQTMREVYCDLTVNCWNDFGALGGDQVMAWELCMSDEESSWLGDPDWRPQVDFGAFCSPQYQPGTPHWDLDVCRADLERLLDEDECPENSNRTYEKQSFMSRECYNFTPETPC